METGVMSERRLAAQTSMKRADTFDIGSPDVGPAVDLATRGQIHDLVVSFYRELIMDDNLGPVFSEVAEVDWSHHIPLLIDYWCRVLLGDPSYQGAILDAHRRMHDLQAFTAENFDRWYALWIITIDHTWSGPLAEKAKAHAARIAASLARQLPRIAWEPTQLQTGTRGAKGDTD
jgi:hemoglobin